METDCQRGEYTVGSEGAGGDHQLRNVGGL